MERSELCLTAGNMCAIVAPFGISGGMGRMDVCVLVMTVPFVRLTVIPCVMSVTCVRMPCACK
jgi:hypothetical protein